MIDRPQANRDALTACALLGLFFIAIALGAYLYTLDWQMPFPRDGTTLVVGRDFLNFWMYGHAAQLPRPGQWYDPLVYNNALTAMLGENYPGQNWSYPPSIMLLMAPFARIGYLPALALWTLLGAVMFIPTVWRYLGNRRAVIAVMCSPAAVFGVISGQVAFVTTAMMIGAFCWLDRRPVSAGILIGLLTLKPHMGILFPVLLIVSQRWRVFVVATLTAVMLVAVSIALFGLDPWIDYWRVGIPVQNIVLRDADHIATPFFPTLFMNLRGIGASYELAMGAQIALAVMATALLAWAIRTRPQADPRLLAALFFACSIAAIPYMLSYGTLALCVSAIALLADGALDARGRLLARLVYWLPLIQIGLGTFHIPGPALIAPAFALYLFLYLKDDRAGVAHPALQRA